MRDKIKVISIDEDEKKLLMTFHQRAEELKLNKSKLELMNNQREEMIKQYNSINQVKIKSVNDLNTLRLLISLIKTYYNKDKMDKMKNMEDSISKVVNNLFKDVHKFRLKDSVVKGYTNVNLVSVDDKEKSLGDIGVIVSDSQQQAIGYLMQKITLNEFSSYLIILDEAFNSFGIDELRPLADFIIADKEFQHIMVEHKKELFDVLEEHPDACIIRYTMKREHGKVKIDKVKGKENIEKWKDILSEEVYNTYIQPYLQSI